MCINDLVNESINIPTDVSNIYMHLEITRSQV